MTLPPLKNIPLMPLIEHSVMLEFTMNEELTKICTNLNMRGHSSQKVKQLFMNIFLSTMVVHGKLFVVTDMTFLLWT